MIQSVLDKAKAEAGGNLWDAVRLIEGEGEKVSFGLKGAFHDIDQVTTGFFAHQTDYGIFSNAEGIDRAGRWRLDNSGQLHPLNSEEAIAVAVSESYISGRGYFYPKRFTAIFEECQSPTRAHEVCVRATPAKGRAMALWFDATTHLLNRIELTLSVGTERVVYRDYRRVDGILLPFVTTIDHGDESESGTSNVARYNVNSPETVNEVPRPKTHSDVSISAGASDTTTQGHFDQHSGFFIIDAKINGQGPYAFILDTGGHDILTPRMAHRLGLKTLGKGFSGGAGAGTTPTEFTTVSTLTLGEAAVTQQPFTILHVDLGTTKDSAGNEVSIAGILGLELFERFIVTVDYHAKTVLLRLAHGFEYRGQGAEVPIQFTSDMPICAGSIDGHPGVFAIDTGNNTDVIIFPAWSSGNGLDFKMSAPGLETTSVGGDIKLSKGHITKLALGNIDLGAMDVLLSSNSAGSLSDRAEAGNIGNSVLSQFTVTFAYQAGYMYWEHAESIN